MFLSFVVSSYGVFVLTNNTFMGYKIDGFRVSVKTSFDPIKHIELYPF